MARKIITMVAKAVTEQVGSKRKRGDGATVGHTMITRNAAPPADDDDYRVFLNSTPTIVACAAVQDSTYRCPGLNPSAAPWTGGGWLNSPKDGGASAAALPEPLAVTTPSGSDKQPSSMEGAGGSSGSVVMGDGSGRW